MTTPLYRRFMARVDAGELCGDPAIMHEAWDPTPWMIDVYLGTDIDPRIWEHTHEREIREWCEEHFGPEGSPTHRRPGRWHTGHAKIDGWQWFGFDTEDAMMAFKQAWPKNIRSDT